MLISHNIKVIATDIGKIAIWVDSYLVLSGTQRVRIRRSLHQKCVSLVRRAREAGKAGRRGTSATCTVPHAGI